MDGRTSWRRVRGGGTTAPQREVRLRVMAGCADNGWTGSPGAPAQFGWECEDPRTGQNALRFGSPPRPRSVSRGRLTGPPSVSAAAKIWRARMQSVIVGRPQRFEQAQLMLARPSFHQPARPGRPDGCGGGAACGGGGGTYPHRHQSVDLLLFHARTGRGTPVSGALHDSPQEAGLDLCGFLRGAAVCG